MPIVWGVELLERRQALATLAEARAHAARGHGRVVLVAGEPGIGKTALTERFVADIGPDARVLLGTCDDLAIPRPLGPFHDWAGSVSTELERAIAADPAPQRLHPLLLRELSLEPRPTVVVLEDVHWADNATLDAITVVARRIASLPALLVLTLRTGETPPGDPLEAMLGTLATGAAAFLELPPLSEEAVTALAGESAGEVYAATGGNPFFVTEVLDTDDPAPPRSVATAVAGRAARLSDDARALVELVSVVPGRVAMTTLDAAVPGWGVSAEEAERRHLLEVGSRSVRFRHELAREAVRSSLPAATLRRLHSQVLDALLATDAAPAAIVHHAEAAGAEEVVGDYALIAARRAAAADSTREAYAHYHRSLDFLDRLAATEQAAVLEELASAAYFVGRLDDALAAIREAIRLHREADDAPAVGRCMRVRSRLHWFVGEGAPAHADADEAIAILEPLGDSVELARAYSGRSQLAMLADDRPRCVEWGERALELATRLGDEQTRAHALVNLGSVQAQLEPGATAALLEAHAVAHRSGEREQATRALTNLAFSSMRWARTDAALAYADRARAYAEEHEAHNFASYNAITTAWLCLRRGDWDAAHHLATSGARSRNTVAELMADTVLAELAVRRGDPDATARLAAVTAASDRTGELQRIVPVLELVAERALTSSDPMPQERLAQLAISFGERGAKAGCEEAHVAGWAAVAGIPTAFEVPQWTPYAAMARGDWAAAAVAFGTAGWPYDRALMLSLLDDPAALVEALELARTLGAAPLVARVTRRLRTLGSTVPRGPRAATRSNPAGLTARQLEVLALLVDGRTNAQIAETLVVSVRTAEHHVAAVLAKLGAAGRRDAAQRAEALGLLAQTP